ncbi:MAG: homoserine O-succinyltransferase, partial [Oscillospiraceae bacterium]|nr:homoserine O-succinyltransferase [Oscillospiraceae bacterium]
LVNGKCPECGMEVHPAKEEAYLFKMSKYADRLIDHIEKHPELQILSYSPLAGVLLVQSRDGRQIFITGHAEYERDTLKEEYFRDLKKGLPIEVPRNYFPGDNPNYEPIFSWRCHANLLYSNWLNYCVYQKTPFKAEDIENLS